jgi:cytochrome c
MTLSIAALLLAAGLAAPGAQAQATAPAAGDPATGRQAFDATCRGCHGGMIAPNLRGVVGRPIASREDFMGYSPGLKAKGGETWSEATLDAFLTSPEAFAPGSAMVASVPDAATRANVIAYLKTLQPAE